MAWTSKVALSLAELIIYCGLASIFVYTAIKHRKPSISGHVYIFAFVALRLVTDGLAISRRDQPPAANEKGATINSIGLSPLLLATAGFVNEARWYILDYRHDKLAQKTGFFHEVLFHLAVITGVLLLALGRTRAAKASTLSDLSKYQHLEYAGAALLLLAWLAICGLAFWTVLATRKGLGSGRNQKQAKRLISGMLVSLVFTGIRVTYTMVYTFDNAASLQPPTATFAIYFFPLFLSQLLAVLLVATVLILTRDIVAESPTETSTQDNLPKTAHRETSTA